VIMSTGMPAANARQTSRTAKIVHAKGLSLAAVRRLRAGNG
jgi:hypothetical protein